MSTVTKSYSMSTPTAGSINFTITFGVDETISGTATYTPAAGSSLSPISFNNLTGHYQSGKNPNVIGVSTWQTEKGGSCLMNFIVDPTYNNPSIPSFMVTDGTTSFAQGPKVSIREVTPVA